MAGEGGPVDGRFSGQVALVTGGAAGIGREYALRFAREGASVVIVDRAVEAGRAFASELTAQGLQARFVAADVADEGAPQAAVDVAVSSFGGVDVLVNNAAIHLAASRAPFTVEAVGQWRRIMEVNMMAPLRWTLACRATMRERGGGVVLNQSSASSLRVRGAYGVSKLALNGLTATLARELGAEGIRVVGLAPGFVDSPAALASKGDDGVAERLQEQALKRIGSMSELAEAALFLCSRQGAHITGTTLVVDGGLTCMPL